MIPRVVMIAANCTAGTKTDCEGTPYGPKCKRTASIMVEMQQAANTTISVKAPAEN